VTTRVELEPFEGRAALARHRAAWREALDASGADPLCNAPAWGEAYAEAWLEADDVFGWVARADGAVVGFLPFRTEPARGGLALRRALLLADGSFDSDYLDLLVHPAHVEAVVRALLDALRRSRRAQVLVLGAVAADSRALAAVRTELQRRRVPFREREAPCLAAPLPATFEDYVAGLPKRMRSKVRRSLRDAQAQGATHRWCDAPDVERGMETLFALHAARWRAAGDEGSFADARRRQMYARVARDAAEAGELRLSELVLDDRVIATQFGVRVGATYYQLQEGYDPTLGDWRPATSLRALGVRDLIAAGTTSYDFLGGDGRHKRDWGGAPRPCRTLALPIGGLRAHAAYALRALQDRRRATAADADDA